MSQPTHLVSAERSHPCVPPLAQGATQHVVVDGRCTRCGTTVSAAAMSATRRGRRGWLGERVLGVVIGSGVLALGIAYLAIAFERTTSAGTSVLSAPAIVGAACMALAGLLFVRAVRG